MAEINLITTFLLAWLVICGYGQPSSAEELAKLQGSWGTAVPGNHARYASGIVKGTMIGEGEIADGMTNKIVYGYKIEFGGDHPHNNVPPSLAAYCWIRSA